MGNLCFKIHGQYLLPGTICACGNFCRVPGRPVMICINSAIWRYRTQDSSIGRKTNFALLDAVNFSLIFFGKSFYAFFKRSSRLVMAPPLSSAAEEKSRPNALRKKASTEMLAKQSRQRRALFVVSMFTTFLLMGAIFGWGPMQLMVRKS